MLTAEEIIKKLNLQPLPIEGGFYTQTYRSEDILPANALPNRYSIDKSFCTAIYYLLTPETQSMLHRLPTDEIYHYYLGDPVQMLNLYPDGSVKKPILGSKITVGHNLQLVVPRDVWQGSYLIEGGRFALMGTTMAPGFDSSDYEWCNRDTLIKRYPGNKKIISRLTPES